MHDDAWFTVYCFGTEADAKGFMAIFGGERFNPGDRGRGASWMKWKKRG